MTGLHSDLSAINDSPPPAHIASPTSPHGMHEDLLTGEVQSFRDPDSLQRGLSPLSNDGIPGLTAYNSSNNNTYHNSHNNTATTNHYAAAKIPSPPRGTAGGDDQYGAHKAYSGNTLDSISNRYYNTNTSSDKNDKANVSGILQSVYHHPSSELGGGKDGNARTAPEARDTPSSSWRTTRVNQATPTTLYTPMSPINTWASPAAASASFDTATTVAATASAATGRVPALSPSALDESTGEKNRVQALLEEYRSRQATATAARLVSPSASVSHLVSPRQSTTSPAIGINSSSSSTNKYTTNSNDASDVARARAGRYGPAGATSRSTMLSPPSSALESPSYATGPSKINLRDEVDIQRALRNLYTSPPPPPAPYSYSNSTKNDNNNGSRFDRDANVGSTNTSHIRLQRFASVTSTANQSYSKHASDAHHYFAPRAASAFESGANYVSATAASNTTAPNAATDALRRSHTSVSTLWGAAGAAAAAASRVKSPASSVPPPMSPSPFADVRSSWAVLRDYLGENQTYHTSASSSGVLLPPPAPPPPLSRSSRILPPPLSPTSPVWGGRAALDSAAGGGGGSSSRRQRIGRQDVQSSRYLGSSHLGRGYTSTGQEYRRYYSNTSNLYYPHYNTTSSRNVRPDSSDNNNYYDGRHNVSVTDVDDEDRVVHPPVCMTDSDNNLHPHSIDSLHSSHLFDVNTSIVDEQEQQQQHENEESTDAVRARRQMLHQLTPPPPPTPSSSAASAHRNKSQGRRKRKQKHHHRHHHKSASLRDERHEHVHPSSGTRGKLHSDDGVHEHTRTMNDRFASANNYSNRDIEGGNDSWSAAAANVQREFAAVEAAEVTGAQKRRRLAQVMRRALASASLSASVSSPSDANTDTRTTASTSPSSSSCLSLSSSTQSLSSPHDSSRAKDDEEEEEGASNAASSPLAQFLHMTADEWNGSDDWAGSDAADGTHKHTTHTHSAHRSRHIHAKTKEKHKHRSRAARRHTRSSSRGSDGKNEEPNVVSENSHEHKHTSRKLREAAAKAEKMARHLVTAIREKHKMRHLVTTLQTRCADATHTNTSLRVVLRAAQRESSAASAEMERLHRLLQPDINFSSNNTNNTAFASTASMPRSEQTTQRAAELDWALAELGLAHARQREAELGAERLRAELGSAVRHIQLLDEALTTAERRAAQERLHGWRKNDLMLPDDENGDGSDSSRANSASDKNSKSNNSTVDCTGGVDVARALLQNYMSKHKTDAGNTRSSSAAMMQSWPAAARFALSRLTTHSEALALRHAEGARAAALHLSHLRRRNAALRHEVQHGRRALQITRRECAALHRDKAALRLHHQTCRRQLRAIRHAAERVCAMVHTSRKEAVAVRAAAERCIRHSEDLLLSTRRRKTKRSKRHDDASSSHSSRDSNRTSNDHTAKQENNNESRGPNDAQSSSRAVNQARRVRRFTQQVMLDFHAMAQLLFALRAKMTNDSDNEGETDYMDQTESYTALLHRARDRYARHSRHAHSTHKSGGDIFENDTTMDSDAHGMPRRQRHAPGSTLSALAQQMRGRCAFVIDAVDAALARRSGGGAGAATAASASPLSAPFYPAPTGGSVPESRLDANNDEQDSSPRSCIRRAVSAESVSQPDRLDDSEHEVELANSACVCFTTPFVANSPPPSWHLQSSSHPSGHVTSTAHQPKSAASSSSSSTSSSSSSMISTAVPSRLARMRAHPASKLTLLDAGELWSSEFAAPPPVSGWVDRTPHPATDEQDESVGAYDRGAVDHPVGDAGTHPVSYTAYSDDGHKSRNKRLDQNNSVESIRNNSNVNDTGGIQSVEEDAKSTSSLQRHHGSGSNNDIHKEEDGGVSTHASAGRAHDTTAQTHRPTSNTTRDGDSGPTATLVAAEAMTHNTNSTSPTSSPQCAPHTAAPPEPASLDSFTVHGNHGVHHIDTVRDGVAPVQHLSSEDRPSSDVVVGQKGHVNRTVVHADAEESLPGDTVAVVGHEKSATRTDVRADTDNHTPTAPDPSSSLDDEPDNDEPALHYTTAPLPSARAASAGVSQLPPPAASTTSTSAAAASHATPTRHSSGGLNVRRGIAGKVSVSPTDSIASDNHSNVNGGRLNKDGIAAEKNLHVNHEALAKTPVHGEDAQCTAQARERDNTVNNTSSGAHDRWMFDQRSNRGTISSIDPVSSRIHGSNSSSSTSPATHTDRGRAGTTFSNGNDGSSKIAADRNRSHTPMSSHTEDRRMGREEEEEEEQQQQQPSVHVPPRAAHSLTHSAHLPQLQRSLPVTPASSSTSSSLPELPHSAKLQHHPQAPLAQQAVVAHGDNGDSNDDGSDNVGNNGNHCTNTLASNDNRDNPSVDAVMGTYAEDNYSANNNSDGYEYSEDDAHATAEQRQRLRESDFAEVVIDVDETEVRLRRYASAENDYEMDSEEESPSRNAPVKNMYGAPKEEEEVMLSGTLPMQQQLSPRVSFEDHTPTEACRSPLSLSMLSRNSEAYARSEAPVPISMPSPCNVLQSAQHKTLRHDNTNAEQWQMSQTPRLRQETFVSSSSSSMFTEPQQQEMQLAGAVVTAAAADGGSDGSVQSKPTSHSAADAEATPQSRQRQRSPSPTYLLPGSANVITLRRQREPSPPVVVVGTAYQNSSRQPSPAAATTPVPHLLRRIPFFPGATSRHAVGFIDVGAGVTRRSRSTSHSPPLYSSRSSSRGSTSAIPGNNLTNNNSDNNSIGSYTLFGALSAAASRIAKENAESNLTGTGAAWSQATPIEVSPLSSDRSFTNHSLDDVDDSFWKGPAGVRGSGSTNVCRKLEASPPERQLNRVVESSVERGQSPPGSQPRRSCSSTTSVGDTLTAVSTSSSDRRAEVDRIIARLRAHKLQKQQRQQKQQQQQQ